MHNQAIGAGQFHENGRGQGVGIGPSSRLPECRHMIDIYTQSSHYASAISLHVIGERFRNWSKFIDNSLVTEALLTEDGMREQGARSWEPSLF
jgi:hypothetical protein